MRPVCLLDRTKNLHQSDRLHFISDSLEISPLSNLQPNYESTDQGADEADFGKENSAWRASRHALDGGQYLHIIQVVPALIE